jgi:hypothetical protein
MNDINEEDSKDLIQVAPSSHHNGFRDITNEVANESVRVSIEPNHESEIFEIKYDGQELYKELANDLILLESIFFCIICSK